MAANNGSIVALNERFRLERPALSRDLQRSETVPGWGPRGRKARPSTPPISSEPPRPPSHSLMYDGATIRGSELSGTETSRLKALLCKE